MGIIGVTLRLGCSGKRDTVGGWLSNKCMDSSEFIPTCSARGFRHQRECKTKYIFMGIKPGCSRQCYEMDLCPNLG